MVGDHFGKKWEDQYPTVLPNTTITYVSGITREEFEALKKEVQDVKELLKKAKAYDEETGQKDCEMEEKIALLKRFAEFVGVDLTDALP